VASTKVRLSPKDLPTQIHRVCKLSRNSPRFKCEIWTFSKTNLRTAIYQDLPIEIQDDDPDAESSIQPAHDIFNLLDVWRRQESIIRIT
jgi:hypothetical protein